MAMTSCVTHTFFILSLIPTPRTLTYHPFSPFSLGRERLYANMEDLYAEVPRDEDPYGYGDETIYDSICYYQAPVGYTLLQSIMRVETFTRMWFGLTSWDLCMLLVNSVAVSLSSSR